MPIRSSYTSVVTFTRPDNATAYGAGDAVGAADTVTPANAGSAILTFASIGPPGTPITITAADLRIDLAAVPGSMAGFTLHLYNASPAAILDNAAFDLVSGDRTKYLGSIDLTIPIDLGSTLFVQAAPNKRVKLITSSLYGVLVTAGAYTPANLTVLSVRLQSTAQ